MKLIEGMKQLRVIQKRIAANTERINQYAAIVSSERPIFGTEAEQRKQVEALIQANKDLVAEYLRLKKAVDLTNIQTQAQIGKASYSISDLLQIRRGMGKMLLQTYGALNDRLAEGRLALMRTQSDKPPRVERMYDEKAKHEGMQECMALLDEIETRLEVINATTDLVDL